MHCVSVMVSSSLLAPILVFVLDQTHIHTNDCLSLSVPDAGMSPGAVAGIVVAVFLLVVAAAGVVKYYHRVAGFVCYRCKISERQRGKYHTQFM